MTKPNWEYHSICLLFPRHTAEERDELKRNMVERIKLGLDPLENDLVFFEKKLLDGRNRFEAWYELDDENACDGYFGRNLPTTTEFCPAKHGTLAAWMKAKALNMVHRHIAADQKAAIFLEVAEQFPEVKAALDQIKEENATRQKAGKPVDAGDHRGSTAEQIADLAGVGPTTVKQVGKLKKEAPEKFKEVMQGKTTVKKALREVKKTAPQPPKKKAPAAKAKEIQVGDTVFQVVVPSVWRSVPSVIERTIKAITAKNYVCADGRLRKTEQVFLGQDAVMKAWRAVVDEQIAKLKDAVKEGPAVGK